MNNRDRMISIFRASANIVAGSLVGAIIGGTAYRLTGKGPALTGAIEGLASSFSATLCLNHLEDNNYKGGAAVIVSGIIGWWAMGPLRDILGDRANSLLLIGTAFPAIHKKDVTNLANRFFPVRPENIKSATASTQDYV